MFRGGTCGECGQTLHGPGERVGWRPVITGRGLKGSPSSLGPETSV